MGSSDSFPAIEESFRFLPHSPSFTYDIPASASPTPDVDLPPTSPLSATTIINFHGPIVTSGLPLPTTFLTLPYFPHHFTHTVTLRLPHSTTSNPAMSAETTAISTSTSTSTSSSSSTSTKGLPQGAKIGIALGITVTVLLSLLACTIGALSLRRRVLAQRHKKRARHASELAMWEVEMRRSRTGGAGRRHRERELKTGGGLWDELKGPLPVYRAERAGDGEAEMGRRKEKDGEAGSERDQDVPGESLPVYASHERGSVVSSVGSLGVPGATRAPVSVRSFLSGRR